MNILRALAREEKKSLKLIQETERRVATIRKAMKALGGRAVRKAKRRSKAARARMSRGQKKRWAKVRAEKKASG